MLTYRPEDYDSPTLSLDLGQAVTAENIDALTQPVANRNSSGSSTFQNAIDNVLHLFENGKAIYDGVQETIGTAKAQAAAKKSAASQTVIVSPNNPSLVLGLNTTQLLLIAAGLTALLVIPRLMKGR